MLAQLVKVANRLDSLGLTKEADILDLEIIRLASDSVPEMTGVQLAEKNVKDAQEAFDKAVKTLKENKSISARSKLNEAKNAAERNLEEANSKLKRAKEIQNESTGEATGEATEETPTERPSLVDPEVVQRTIRRPNTVDTVKSNITEYSRPSELTIEGEYPKNPKKLADLDPDSFYVFQLIKPERSKPIWLFDGKFSSLEAANSYVGEEDDKIVLIGKKVKEYILNGKNVYNSGAMLRLRAPWGGSDVALSTNMPSTSTPRAKGAE